MTKKVLVTWVAVGNDPYEFDKQSQRYREVNGAKLVGPTLSLLEGEYSHLRTQIHDVVLLYRDIHSSEREKHAVRDLRAELKKRDIKVHPKAWGGVDPTDHKAIFEFLRKAIPEIRNDFPEAELVVHVSPGTPAMHTVWVLMAETGFIDPPFQIVQSKRESERRGLEALCHEVRGDANRVRIGHPNHTALFVYTKRPAIRW
ncbi:hypothetical protein FRD01_19985 [Microvenator marinus]|uniref:Uncharacterized protein n=1 Tax=Microvenator marinus TaxID=2600177 RepID=A0A5B8XZI8_9DELT|nr:hypothetical protein [Microvenator marinus]QED29473.1 hypothetical protein FRD01_19985 [Microvenator marinus]